MSCDNNSQPSGGLGTSDKDDAGSNLALEQFDFGGQSQEQM